MSKVNQKLIDEQTKLIQDIDVAKEMDKFLTRTLFLEKIRKHQEEEYNKGVKLLEEEKAQLSTLEKFKRRKEFEEKMEELRREKFKLETIMYENILKDQFNKIDKKSKLIENVTTDLKQQAYKDDFNEILKKAFPQVYKELTTELTALKESQKLDSRQAVFHLLKTTTGSKDLVSQLDDLYKENNLKKIKEEAIKNSLTALKITGGLINPVGFIIRGIASRVSEIPVMKKVLNNINEKFDEALDVLGVSEKHKKYIKIAGGVVTSALVVGFTGSVLLPHEVLNADELLSGLDSVKDKATESLSDKMENVKAMMQSTNSAESVNIVKEAVANIELPKTEFTEGLKEHLGVKAEPAAFTSSDLLVNQPEVKLPETYNDIKPQNFVMDPEKAAALKEVTLTGEVPEILKQDGASVTAATTDLNDSKVATQQDILNDLNGGEKNTVNTSVEINAPEMEKYVIQKGDTLSGIVEKLDSKEFDLQGEKLYAVVQLIAEQNNISNPHHILAGATIDIPKDTAALEAYCEANKEKLSEIMGRDFIQSAQPMVSQATSIELPAHTTPVSASPNGFTQLAPEIEMPETVPVVEVPKEMLAQNSRLIASNILEGMPKEELEKFMSKVRTDENQLLDILSANIEKQIMANPQGQFDPNKIVIDFNQDKAALEKEFGRTISDSMIRRMGGTLEIQPFQIMTAYTSVENELRATLTPVTQVSNPTIELPQQPLSNGSITPEGKLEITTKEVDGKEIVVHRTVRP